LFRFEHTIFLWALLAVIPLLLLVFLFIQNWKKRKLKQFGDSQIINRLMPNVAKKQPIVKFVLYLLAIISLFLGLANLQYGTKEYSMLKSKQCL